MRHLRVLACATVLAAVAAPAATAAPKRIVPVAGQEIAWTRGFDLMLWDSANGVRQITRNTAAYDPNLSSDGRYLVYTTKQGAGCRRVVLRDLWRGRNVALPGLLRGDPGDCVDSPHLSRDAKLLVWSGAGAGGYDLYMYDVVAKRRIILPASINTGSTEQSPSLSDDGNRLAFVSGRNGISHGDDILLADISLLRTTGRANLIAPTPAGLQSSEEQASAEMSGNTSTFVWASGTSSLGNKSFVFDARGAGQLLPAPALRSGQSTYGPAVNRDGSIVVVAHQQRDLGDTAVFVWRRTTGSFVAPRALGSTLGDTDPTVSWPARVADLKPPRLKLTCRGAFRRVTCTLRTNEAAKGTVRATIGGRALKAKKASFRRPGKKTLVFRTRRSGTVKASAKLADRAGNVGRAKRSARAR
jgi:WD40 repeat protein